MAYQHPLLGAALGWKHHHAPGIRTADGWLTAWPATLDPFPTDAQLAQWVQEYESFRAAQPVPKSRAQLLAELDGAVTIDQLKTAIKALLGA